MADSLAELLVADRAAWHAWLAENHDSSAGVRLVLARKGATQPTNLTYDQALEEALCVGWIDGRLNARDDNSFLRRFTPRRPRSTWSRRNVELVESLRAANRMRPSGEAEVDRAVADGRWEAAYRGAATIEVPADLADALADEPRAQAMFDILTSSNRYAVVLRTTQAKTAATRARRIAGFVEMLSSGRTPYPQRRQLEE
jgi:uncharacterized protein YdeI (YjbR/CyaY-like superfamily)